MKRNKVSSTVITVIFISFTAIVGILNIPNIFSVKWKDLFKDKSFASAGNAYAENFAGKFYIVTAEGAIKKLFGTNEFNSVKRIKDADSKGQDVYVSSVDYVYDYNVKAQSIINLYSSLKEKGIDFVYVQMPHEISPSDSGTVDDYSNIMADGTLGFMRENDVPYIDMRETVNNYFPNYYDAFYITDHHWTVEASFFAFIDLIKFIDKDNEIPSSYIDRNSYEYRNLDDKFLGSNGRRVGPVYSTFDSYGILLPTFSTDYKSTRDDCEFKGSFEEVFIDYDYVSGDNYYEKEQFNTYLGDEAGKITILNDNAPSRKKVLIFRDSYARPIISYMSTCFERVDAIDLRHTDMKVSELVNYDDYDIVIVAYCPYMFEYNFMFDFEE